MGDYADEYIEAHEFRDYDNDNDHKGTPMTTDPIEQLRKVAKQANIGWLNDGGYVEVIDLPAILAAWEVDRADIERLDKCHMNDLRTIIDLQQTLGEAQSRIAKLEAVVEAAKEVYPTLDRHADILASETLRRAAGILLNALSALEGGQYDQH
jgi:hypothetical protein